MKNLVKKLSLQLARIPGVPAAAHYITTRTNHQGTYPYYRELFINNGRNSAFDSKAGRHKHALRKMRIQTMMALSSV
jgi:hypothetical protein